jgi:DNA helicase II / ATP-dependent DNA helicase PcrA
VTRAADELRCSWAEKRTFGSRTVSRTRSPWLDAIDAACRALASGDPTADWRGFLDEGRSRLKATRAASSSRGRRSAITIGANADPAVLDALRTWRATAARAAGVPAFLIFHDATLAAVAEARPRNRDALLALPGLGPVKADRYGEAVLEVVARHAATA